MSLPGLPCDDLREPFGVFPDEKEGGPDVIFGENVEDLIRACRMRTVVEGQGDPPILHGAGVDHVGRIRSRLRKNQDGRGDTGGDSGSQSFPHSSSRVPKRYPISFH